jgi:hypothetical protein
VRWFDWLLLLLVGLCSSAWSLSVARQLGPTFDEPLYLHGGLRFWREGKPGELLQVGTMPLPAQVVTLPLYLIERFSGHPWDWPGDLGPMLVIARTTALVFWWLLLFYTLRFGHALGGPWTGRLALLLVAVEPSFLAHASLAGTDMLLATCVLVFTYHFRAGRDSGWGWRVGLPALLFGIGVLAKASALTFGVLVMVGVELERLARNGTLARAWNGTYRERWGNLWRDSLCLRRDGLAIVGLGFLVVFAGCGSDWEPSRPMLATIERSPANTPFRSWALAIAQAPIWPNAGYTIWYQVKHNIVGHQTYLIGYESLKSLWFYFPVLLAIKVPVVLLFLLAVVLLAPGPRFNLALSLAGLLFLFSLTIKVQLGVRLVLPLFLFLIVGVSARLVDLAQRMPARPRWVSIGGMAILLGWLLVGDLRLWPDTLRYTNELWGGTEEGYRLVSDSNYDWGQGLPELANWHEQHPGSLTVWYFGTDPRFADLTRYWPQRDGLDSPKLQARYLAVGTTNLYGGYLTDAPDREMMFRLRQLEPIARTRTFLIFHQGGSGELPRHSEGTQ